MNYTYNDGGRQTEGCYKGTAGDCGARAMAIALELNYKVVYKEIAQANLRRPIPYATSSKDCFCVYRLQV